MKNRLIQQEKVIKKNLHLFDMLPLEGDEEVKEGKGLEVLTPNKV